MSSLTWLLASIFLILTNLSAFVTAQIQCINDGNYTSNSTYRANLNTLLSTLSSNVDSNGFYNASVGENLDRAYATVLCRGDLQLDTCRSCIQNATIDLVQACPNHKKAILWTDICMLRYSNESMFGILANSPRYFWWNTQNFTSPDQFNEDLRTLLDSLRGRAASGGSLQKVAAENRTTSDFQTIFALLQCTPDISPEDCVNCLLWAAVPRYCERKIGCRVISPSCTLRYETRPFYNETRLQELQVAVVGLPTPSIPPLPSPSPPPPPPPTGKHICINDGNYKSNSTYQTNLYTLLSSALSSNVDRNGFYDNSVGRNLDRVYGTVFCRGDVQLDICRNCIQDAAIEIVQACPNQKKAILWKEFCTLRYSNESMYAVLAISPEESEFITQKNQVPESFVEVLMTLLDDLGSQAVVYGSPLRKVAAGNRTASDFTTIYALVQCSPDLNPADCRRCLTGAFDLLPKGCVRNIGCRALRPSCNLRFEISPFYNETRLQEFTELVPNPMPPIPKELVPNPMPPIPNISLPPAAKKDDSTTRTVIIVVVSIAACLLLVPVCVGVLLRKRIKQNSYQEPEIEGENSAVKSLQYDFGKISAATHDFSDANKLGQGGFGPVYRGKLSNGKEIAVKRLSTDSRQGDVEFKNEVLLVARLQHRNLVRLLGFSLERNEKLLVYELVQNGSLDQFIFDPIKRSNLDWEMRYKIIGGIAKGLLYLHEDSRLRIIHRDLKAGNILLDREMNPKISDFGMARLFVPDETQGNTSRIAGTYGYMAPEYVMYGQFSVKSDVFSFGVLVLEILSGQKKNSFRDGENVEDLLCCAWKYWRQGTTTNLIDPVLRGDSGSMRDMLRCIHIGLLCVQENVLDRPTMASVVLMLSSFSQTLPVPSEPAFFVASRFDSGISQLQENNSSGLESQSSKNDASITELYPR